jgi:membrane protease YdiL (CAAX protease family)
MRSLGKSDWKKIIDLTLYLLFCALAGTGLLLAYRLPHGGGAGHALFLGHGRHIWGEVHTWLAYAAIIIGAVHLLLNWQWLVKVAASKRPWRLAIGIVAGLLIASVFIFVPTQQEVGHTRQRAGAVDIEQLSGTADVLQMGSAAHEFGR